MITIRELEKDERHAAYVIKKFIQNQPIFILLVSTIGVCIALFTFTIIMLLAAVGGNQLDIALKGQVCSGQLPVSSYNILMGVVLTIYNTYSILINFTISVIILVWLYIIFKEYLKYKRDNL